MFILQIGLFPTINLNVIVIMVGFNMKKDPHYAEVIIRMDAHLPYTQQLYRRI